MPLTGGGQDGTSSGTQQLAGLGYVATGPAAGFGETGSSPAVGTVPGYTPPYPGYAGSSGTPTGSSGTTASPGAGTPAAGGTASSSTTANATLASMTASGNPLTDMLEWLGNFTILGGKDFTGIVNAFKDGAQAVIDTNHTLAYALDTALTMFKPGQAWRIVFAGITVGLGAGAVIVYRQGDDKRLPLVIALTGGGLLTGYMAFRPWPAPTGKPIKPGAYAYEILEGDVPAEGPPALSPVEVQATEYAIGAFEAIWFTQKLASVFGNLAEAVYDAKQAALGWWGDLF